MRLSMRKYPLPIRLIIKLVFCVFILCGNMPAFTDDTGNLEVLVSGSRLKEILDVSNRRIISLGALKKGGVTIQNMSKNLIHLEYKAEWFDDFAMPTSNGVWQRFTLHPNLGKGIVSVSKTVQGKHLVVKIRLPDDSEIKGKYFKQSLSRPKARPNSDNSK